MSLPPSPLLSLEDVLRPDRTALIVWDMQVGVAARAHNLASLRPALDTVLAAARASGVTVVWSRHISPEPRFTAPPTLRSMMLRQGVQTVDKLKGGLRAGSAEVELLPGLVPAPGEPVLEKSTASFFVGTSLELKLRARAITTVVLTGVATEHGIEFTARHAGALGFYVVVAEDAIGSFTPEGHELGMAYLRQASDLVTTDRLAAIWSRHQ